MYYLRKEQETSMLFTLFKLGLSAGVIAFASWLSGKRPDLAGFIISLPLLTLLVLPFSHAEHQDPANSIAFAKSIFLAVPLSLVFFVPFLLADRLPFGFWGLYTSGIILLAAVYFIHQWIFHYLT